MRFVPPETRSRVLYAEIPRVQIALYRFLLEGYDNLAVMSVVDRFRAVIRLRYTSHAEQTLRDFLTAQGAKILEIPRISQVELAIGRAEMKSAPPAHGKDNPDRRN